MGNTTDATISAEDGIRHYVDFKVEYSLTPDEIAEFVNDLPDAKKMAILAAILENPEGVIKFLEDMGTDDRLQVLQEFCRGCGAKDPWCRCDCPCVED